MSDHYIQELRNKIETASASERAQLVKNAATFLGITPKTVYAKLREMGWTSGRKRRADKGSSSMSEDEVRHVASIMRQSDRASKKQLLTIDDSTEVSFYNGGTETMLSPSRVSQLMKRYGVHPKQMHRATPHVNLKSHHPNHLWQIDASICVLYYLRDGGNTMGIMDEEEFYKNKPQNFAKIAKKRILRYIATDHASGAFFCRYYHTSGETEQVTFKFLMAAMGEKDKQKNPFEGVPKMLYWDKGAGNQSGTIKNLLERLGVQHSAHKQGNSRAKGQVEKTHDIVERRFEGRLAFHKISSIEELNNAVESWQRQFQSSPKHAHSRHKMPRFTAWRMIKEDELVFRPPLEICKSLLSSKPETREIRGNYQISFEGNYYSLSEVDNIIVGEKVTVTVNPYKYPNIWVTHPNRFGEDVRYEIEPLQRDAFGFFSDAVSIDGHHQQAPLTTIDKNRQDLDEMAYGTRDEQEINKLRRKKSVPAFGGKVDALSYLKNLDEANDTKRVPKRGKPLEIEGIQTVEREEQALPVINFIRWFAANHQITPELNKHIRAKYPDGVKESEYEEIAERLVSRTALKVVNN